MVRLPSLSALLLLALSLSCAQCSSPYRRLIDAEVKPSQGRTLIQDVSVFTAVDTRVLKRHDVLIGEGEILAIGPTGTLKARGARVLDGRGKTLLPGFIDTHVHVSFSGSTPYADLSPDPVHNLHAFLYSGVTTIYDLGGDAGELSALKAQVSSGELLGPRLFHTHIPITVPGSHPLPITQTLLPWPLGSIASLIIPQISSLAEVEPVIDDVISRGVDYVKLTADQLPPGTPEMSDEVLSAAVRHVRARGLKAVIHIGGIDKALVAAQAGAAALVHHTWRTNITEAEARRLAETGVYYMATLSGWVATAEMTEGRFKPSALAHALTPASVVESVTGEAGKRILTIPSVGEMSRFAAEMRPTWGPSLKRLYQAGVPLLIGTDAGVPGVFPGSSFHDELRLLSEAGVPNAELLIAATSRGARWLNPEANFGTIEVGKVADLVIIEGDPLADIRATAEVRHVFLKAQELKRVLPSGR